MDDLIKDLYDWAKYFAGWERCGFCGIKPYELFKLSVLLECAAQTICELRTERDIAKATVRSLRHE